MGYQSEKKLVREYFQSTENAEAETIQSIIKTFVSDDFSFKGTKKSYQWLQSVCLELNIFKHIFDTEYFQKIKHLTYES